MALNNALHRKAATVDLRDLIHVQRQRYDESNYFVCPSEDVYIGGGSADGEDGSKDGGDESDSESSGSWSESDSEEEEE